MWLWHIVKNMDQGSEIIHSPSSWAFEQWCQFIIKKQERKKEKSSPSPECCLIGKHTASSFFDLKQTPNHDFCFTHYIKAHNLFFLEQIKAQGLCDRSFKIGQNPSVPCLAKYIRAFWLPYQRNEGLILKRMKCFFFSFLFF